MVSAQEPIPVMIDSDMTSDDWMAVLYVLNNSNYSVKAITVTGTGFAYCDAGIRAALGLLALVEADGIPVSCGAEAPLMGNNAPPSDWRTTLAKVEAAGLPEGGAAAAEDAVTLFTSVLETSPEKVTVLALGPLTNIAAALEAKPELTEKIEMIYLMGGAVDVPGSRVSDQNTTAEWNIYSDPHAARLVFESGAPLTLIPLDATNAMPVTNAFVSKLEAVKGTPVADFIHTLLLDNQDGIDGGYYFLWDQLAAVVMTHPELVTITPRELTVIDIPGSPEEGRTKPVANGSQIFVVTAPDVEAVEQQLIAGWNS